MNVLDIEAVDGTTEIAPNTKLQLTGGPSRPFKELAFFPSRDTRYCVSASTPTLPARERWKAVIKPADKYERQLLPLKVLHTIRLPAAESDFERPRNVPEWVPPMQISNLSETVLGRIDGRRRSPDFLLEYLLYSKSKKAQREETVEKLKGLLASKDRFQKEFILQSLRGAAGRLLIADND